MAKQSINISNLHGFIDTLFAPGDHIALTCLPEPRQNGVKTVNMVLKRDKLKKTLTPAFLKQQKQAGRNVCVCPNPIKPGTSRRSENVARLNALFVDIDANEINLNKIKPPPHIVTRREKTKLHLYWLLSDTKPTKDNLAKFGALERYLIDQTGADAAVKDYTRVLRLPYTHHIKKGNGKPYRVVKSTKQRRFSLEKLHKVFISTKNIEKEVNRPDAPDFDEKPGDVSDAFIFKFIKSLRDNKELREGDGRSKELFFVGLDCHGWGLKEDKAIRLANEINKTICSPPEAPAIVKHQVESAYRYSKAGFGEFRTALTEKSKHSDRKKELKAYRELERVRDVLKDWVYVAGVERLINLQTGFELTTQTQIANYVTHKSASKVTFSTILRCKLIRVVERLDFRPDIDERIFEMSNGEECLNRFRGLEIYDTEKPKKLNVKAIKVFTDHLKYLTNTEEEFRALQNFFAYIIQNPGSKLPYALLIISRFEGIGKSLLELLFRNVYKTSAGLGYIGTIGNEQLNTGYTHYLADRIFIFVHELAQGDRMATMNRLKNLITEPFVEVNAKYARPYIAKNTANFVMFSNQIDALRISRFDRRLLVVSNVKEPKSNKYYEELTKVYNDDYVSIYYHLMQVNLSKFKPYERPLLTEGKKQLIEQSTSELVLYLTELENSNQGPFGLPLVSPGDIVEYTERLAPRIAQRYTSLKAVRAFLIDRGYESVKFEKRLGPVRVNKFFWCRPAALKALRKADELDKVLRKLAGPVESDGAASSF